ncbi:MAG: metallophosphoesterase family protein [Myxococcales bacterium]|nr:metallophosphoesterase family protein [Myxococcales bacterium]
MTSNWIFAATAACCVAASLTNSAIAAGPKWIRLTWAGNDASSSIAITWNTDSANAKTHIEYGTSTNLGQSASGTSFLGNGNLGHVHEVELIDLEPDTLYYYRVGEPGDWSDIAEFRTLAKPGCGEIRFIALGDGRSQDTTGPAPQWPGIYAQSLDEDPQFVIDTGDLVKDGDDVAQWVNYLKASSPLLQLVPHMPSIGNHDDDSRDGDYATYNQVFQLPRNDTTETEDYYFFTAGDAIFVALSTSTFTGGTYKFQEQADWLDKVLTENPRHWKFVFFHHPPYTSHAEVFGLEFNHEPNEVEQNGALVPVFDKHHVDIVFTGHNHFYERFAPMYGGGASPMGNPVSSPDKGTVYIITGGAGAFTYDAIEIAGIKIDPMEDIVCAGSNQAPGSQKCSGRHHYVTVTIKGDTLQGEVVATAAQNFDTSPSNIEIIDTFGITKTNPAAADCEPDEDPLTPDADTPDPDVQSADAADDVASPDGHSLDKDTEPGVDTTLPTLDLGEQPGTDATFSPDVAANTPDQTAENPGKQGSDTSGTQFVPPSNDVISTPEDTTATTPDKKSSDDSGCYTGSQQSLPPYWFWFLGFLFWITSGRQGLTRIN